MPGVWRRGDPAPCQRLCGQAGADQPERLAGGAFVPAASPDQHGPKQSVEALGHRGFYQEWMIDLYAEAVRLAEETQRRAA